MAFNFVFRFLYGNQPLTLYFYAVPHLCLNLMGYWPGLQEQPQQRRAHIHFMVLGVGVATEMHAGFQFARNGHITLALETFCPAGTSAVTLLKMFLMLRYRSDLSYVLEQLRQMLFDGGNLTAEKQNIMRKHSVMASRLNFWPLSAGFFTCTMYNLKPLIRALVLHLGQTEQITWGTPFNMSMPSFLLRAPFFPITYVFVAYTGYVTIFMFGGCDAFYFEFCAHAATLFKFLQADIRGLFRPHDGFQQMTDLRGTIFEASLVRLIKRQNQIIELTNFFRQRYWIIILAHFVSASMVIAFSIFDLMTVDGNGIGTLLYIGYTVAALSQLFMYCYGGTLVADSESSSLNRLGLSSAAAMFHFLKSNLESDENGGQPVLSSTPQRRSQLAATTTTTTTPIDNNNFTSNEHFSTPLDTNTTTTPLTPPEPHEPHEHHPPAASTPHAVAEEIIAIPVDTVDAAISRKQSISSSPPNKGRKSDSGLPEIRIKAPSVERSVQPPHTPHHHYHQQQQQHYHQQQQQYHHQQQASIGSGSLSKHWSYEHVDSAGDFNLEEENFAQRDHHIIVEVLISSWYALLANTDLICYIVVFINQVVNASVISLPLPIMVFLWGTLSLPRPTKTFWVTLIAYTQAIVLIKCIFQFKLIWANYHNLPNQPLTPAKIFGVEMKTHYAVYDLILLLVLFLHRYLLKSQGLWKSGYKDTDQQFAKPTASIDDREDSDNMSQPDSRQLNEDAAQKMSLQVSQVSLPGSPEYSKSAINQLERTKYTSSLHKFFFSLVHKSRLATDVYALMFLCDFINFFVLLFGFTAFGTQQTESDGGVQTYLAENKVPVPFLIMLLVQFLLIVIDRALYLRKALVNKIIFHFFSVIGIHIWMFFVVPAVTERTFNSLAPPIIFYVIKCFYMLLSSYQIKSGYPKRILGNFFTKGFSMVNMIAFKVYMQIPFLYELRTILDWVCIDSTMTIFDWLKMEDIFSNIYLIRCTRQSETDFPAMRAQKKASLSKLIMGGTVVLLIVICIWGPLCLFALGNAVGTSNVPYQVSVSIRIGPYDPIYTTNNYDSIFEVDSKMYGQMTNAFIKNKQALTFIAGYDATDVAAVKLAGNSPSLWNIAPPDRQRLANDLRNNHTLIARFSYSLTRKAPAKGLKENVGDEHIIKLDETFEGRAALINMLNETYDELEGNEGSTTNSNDTTNANSTTAGNSTTSNAKNSSEVVVVLPNMIPKFIKVLNSGDAFVVTVLSGKEQEYRPLVIKMHRDKSTNGLWWEIRDFCYDNFYNTTLKDLPYSDCSSGIVMYTFNDKKFPSTFSFLTAGGIIGLYTTFVLLASRFMKSFIGGQNRKIMFEDLPYVDRVLQLCLDIYLVREALEFALEEDLFAKLLFLYRSPETLIKWTRPKEEYMDDDGDTDSIPSRMSVRRNEQLQQQQIQHQYQPQ